VAPRRAARARAGVLNFIPNIGPWIAAVPAVLIGFLQGPQQAMYVALLYLLLQAIDGYLLTPLVDRKSVKLPPVLTITAQVLLGVAFGFIGILLASPLTAAAIILVNMVYVEGVLGDRVMQRTLRGRSSY
jgi:predicted PurR-regulated permease PerM